MSEEARPKMVYYTKFGIVYGFHERTDFNKVFNVVILEVCSPKVLDVKEHQFIHKLTSLVPQGINLSNPFSIPLLHK